MTTLAIIIHCMAVFSSDNHAMVQAASDTVNFLQHIRWDYHVMAASHCSVWSAEMHWDSGASLYLRMIFILFHGALPSFLQLYHVRDKIRTCKCNARNGRRFIQDSADNDTAVLCFILIIHNAMQIPPRVHEQNYMSTSSTKWESQPNKNRPNLIHCLPWLINDSE